MAGTPSPALTMAESVRRLGTIARRHGFTMPGYRGQRGHGRPTVASGSGGRPVVTIDSGEGDEVAMVWDIVEGFLAAQPGPVDATAAALLEAYRDRPGDLARLRSLIDEYPVR